MKSFKFGIQKYDEQVLDMGKKSYGAWLNFTHGKKLKKLHTWNAYVVSLLAISGVILYIPTIRGFLGRWRVVIREVHIGLGVVSVLLILLYLPLLHKHWKLLKKNRNQRGNLSYVLFILVGWSVTGLILWQYRHLPQAWSNVAIIGHDLFTWIGIPYAIYHSISRSRWVKQTKQSNSVRDRSMSDMNLNPDTISAKYLSPSELTAYPPQSGQQSVSRRRFLRIASGVIITAGVTPFFYRWIKQNFIGNVADQASSNDLLSAPVDNNTRLLIPKPLPQSDPPIGGGGEGRFRIYTVTNIPSFDPETWKFEISGLVDRPVQFTWKQFLQLKRKVQVSDFHCVTGWSVYHLTWEGIPLTDLLKLVNIDTKAKYVKFYSGDKVYTDNLSLEQAQMSDVMVAVLMDGKPISKNQGGPVRLVVPKMYGYKSVKWLERIELVDKEKLGYWEVRGYDTNAWLNNRPSS